MKKNNGKKEASYIGKNNTVIMIVSILAVTLFIGAAMQPVMAGELPIKGNEPAAVEEECLPCKSKEKINKEDTECKTCVEAVSHAVKYMVDHINKSLNGNGWYLMWPVDASILIFEGIVLGFEDSGFKMEVDYDDLNDFINKTVEKYVGPQLFPVTKLLATLAAISIGITGYLLLLCNDGDDEAQSLPAITQQTRSVSQVIPRFYWWIRILHLLGQ